MKNSRRHSLLACYLITVLMRSQGALCAPDWPVRPDDNGKLVYATDELGNRVPDFSSCGYAGGDRPIPSPAVKIFLSPEAREDGRRIQAAIDSVSALQPDDAGFRGAVLLRAGEYQVADDLRLTASGVVLRGAGAAAGGTTIIAKGVGRRPLVRIGRQGPQEASGSRGKPVAIADAYVPVGATRLRLEQNHGLQTGDRVVVVRPSTDAWIAALGARATGVGWRAGRCDIRWERIIKSVDGAVVTLDAPITTAIEERFGGGTIQTHAPTDRVTGAGIEDLTLRSDCDAANPRDEEHSWYGVVANHAEDLWVRRVRFEGFAGGAVLLRDATRHVTVEDCLALSPVSEPGGYRRHNYMTNGGLTLFLRCFAEQGIHDFGVGHCAPGPNAFVNCYAARARGDSGPLESWASGVLFDNVRIDGADLCIVNRWGQPAGAGWSAANCVLWQCQASVIRAFNPPTAQNWVLGYWAEPFGDAVFLGQSEFVKPLSLYQTQVGDRLGEARAEAAGPFLLDPVESTNPTVEQAEKFVASSTHRTPTLRGLIEARMRRAHRSEIEDAAHGESIPSSTPAEKESEAPPAVRVVNGWLTLGGKVMTGGHVNPTWWRGTIRSQDAAEFGPSITRFAPGRYGEGLTDELESVADRMAERGEVAYDHHYGLWYDRRRDDHLMVRRADGAVTPPFFEQPFARTGEGTAWDGLSKYDLTRFNPWYWGRLARFAELCDQRGLVLIHQHYFQHNILEAGAHWADCPWRPANNVNDTGLPEPPPYVGDKRIFLAEQFYDVTDERRRALHEGQIRHGLEALAGSNNVLHSIGAEYTGPLEFTRFWLDVVRQWKDETGNEPLVALAATKDVQDELLKHEPWRSVVDVIDIRYWCYDREGGLYAPAGGVNLAPRQHFRQMNPKPADPASIARAVREYRILYPQKAVTYFAGMYCRSDNDGWASLMGGGSLADVPPLPEGLARQLVWMRPLESHDEYVLQLVGPKGSRLLYALNGNDRLAVDFPGTTADYRLTWINPKSGQTTEETARLAGRTSLRPKEPVLWITPLKD
ncbi:hypothetical protein Pla175_38170 [Pirellulimonas nuda]|uniref:DUF6298 domain-containing protein n=1 Tax=Pirellulimonas nuda TaxID=2528009 RepID=A0A518DG00_9BACT|nr:DUF6298 domain-containing protein [Pirellulimonas nuda]QDU90413.1 hypothetical protein Pla175_38170 [Pirellulimonas nuda]